MKINGIKAEFIEEEDSNIDNNSFLDFLVSRRGRSDNKLRGGRIRCWWENEDGEIIPKIHKS